MRIAACAGVLGKAEEHVQPGAAGGGPVRVQLWQEDWCEHQPRHQAVVSLHHGESQNISHLSLSHLNVTWERWCDGLWLVWVSGQHLPTPCSQGSAHCPGSVSTLTCRPLTHWLWCCRASVWDPRREVSLSQCWFLSHHQLYSQLTSASSSHLLVFQQPAASSPVRVGGEVCDGEMGELELCQPGESQSGSVREMGVSAQ